MQINMDRNRYIDIETRNTGTVVKANNTISEQNKRSDAQVHRMCAFIIDGIDR